MKKLQNDFTTPEQSKWLLELGLPADSANGAVYPDGHVDYLNNETFTQFAKRIYLSVEACPYKPSWSVGRLIEINTIMNNGKLYIENDLKGSLIDVLITSLKKYIVFTKLEE